MKTTETQPTIRNSSDTFGRNPAADIELWRRMGIKPVSTISKIKRLIKWT